MAKSGYTAKTEGQVASAAPTTAKSILGVLAGAQFGVDLKGFWIDFDGVTASDKPVLVEICEATFATNAPGTNSTTVTVQGVYGELASTGFSAAKSWSAEPTVLVVKDEFSLDPNKGLFRYDWPLGETPDSPLANGYVIRVTVPSGGGAINVRAAMRFERT